MKLHAPLLAGLVSLACPTAALAQGQMPDQGFMDNPPAGNSMSSGTWADMPDGPAVRPYVKSIAVVNGDQSTTVFSGDRSAAQNVQVGDVTATVAPINLCRAGDAPAPGRCYATPNRIGVTLGYKTQQGIGLDFARPEVPLRQTVAPTTVFDVVIGLNSLGSTLRWTWINGGLDGWKTSGLGTSGGEVRMRIRPAVTPEIDWSRESSGGCTATPIFDCDVQQAAGSFLGANLVLSIDESLDAALTGAAFATQGAIAGFLLPGGSPASPSLDLQMASSHLAADGSLQQGTLQAFLPALALTNLYGVLPSDASAFFTAVRRNDPGTQDAPVFTALAAGETSDEGLMVTITGITFSAPTYRVSRRSKPVSIAAKVRSGRTAISTGRVAACRRGACTVSVYRTGKAAPVKVASGRTARTGAARVSTAKLPRGASYLVAIRKNGKLVSGGRGEVR